VINKIFRIFKKQNQKLKIKFTGNKFNEKITEKISIKNKYYKTKLRKIYLVNDKKISEKKINFFIDQITNKIEILNNKKLLNIIKKFAS